MKKITKKKKFNLVKPISQNIETKVDNALLSNQIEIQPKIISFGNGSINGISNLAEEAIRFAENLRKLSLMSNKLSLNLSDNNGILEDLLGK